MKQIAYARWKDVTIAAFGAGTVGREEWKGYADLMRAHGADHRQRVLLFSEGGSLESWQRKEIEILVGPVREHDRRIAMVTGSTVTRGVVKALTLFDPTYRVFSPAELEEALAYVEVPPAAWGEAKKLTGELRGQVAQ